MRKLCHNLFIFGYIDKTTIILLLISNYSCYIEDRVYGYNQAVYPLVTCRKAELSQVYNTLII